MIQGKAHVLGAVAIIAAFSFSAGCSQTAATVEPPVSTDPDVKAREEAFRAAVDDECEAAGKLAEIIMEGRQMGIPLSRTLELADESNRHMVLAAYDVPAFYSNAGRWRAMQNFRNEAEAACQARYL